MPRQKKREEAESELNLLSICLVNGMNEYSNVACKLMTYNLAWNESE